jgi:lipopolysaccharide export system protein LptA
MIMRPAYLCSLMLGAALLTAGAALAQGVSGPPNALQGFSQNREQPVKIDAATLEVRDKNKIATFAGNVQVVQGDTTLRCKTLAVYYDGDSNGSAMKTAQPGPGGQQRIRRLEAKGDVRVTQKDQVATGDLGVFDMASNTVTLTGNVLVTQGQSVLRGEKLTVNLTTGVSHVEGGGKGRVQGVFSGSPGPQSATPPKNDEATTRGSAAREGANQPQQRNSTRPTTGLY